MLTVRSTINIASQTVPPIIPVVQGDTGRAILFTLADFTIPAGASATYYVQKPSGEAVYNNATIDGNTVLVELTAQSIIEKGDNYGQVRIAVGEDIVTSFDFILLVKEFRGIDATESITEMNIFDKAVEQASEAIDEVKTSAIDAVDDAKDTALQEIEQSTGNFADAFSASTTYAAGDYVMHSGQLYRFTANHAAGAWTGSDAEAVTVGEELTDLKADTNTLKEDLSNLQSIVWTAGYIDAVGMIRTVGDRYYSNLLICPPNASVSYVAETNHSNISGISFYDISGAFIGGVHNNGAIGTEMTVTSPDGCAFCRLSTNQAYKDKSYYKIATQGIEYIVKSLAPLNSSKYLSFVTNGTNRSLTNTTVENISIATVVNSDYLITLDYEEDGVGKSIGWVTRIDANAVPGTLLGWRLRRVDNAVMPTGTLADVVEVTRFSDLVTRKDMASTGYVSKSGSDSNSGLSRVNALLTISSAIDKGYKNIIIGEGTYVESLTLTAIRGLHMSLDMNGNNYHATDNPDNPKVVIDGGNSNSNGIVMTDCYDCTFEGIEVCNFTRTAWTIDNCSGITFIDCVVHDIAVGQQIGGGYMTTDSNVDLYNCNAYNIGTTTKGTGVYHLDGFNIHNTGTVNLFNCSAWNCEDDGVSHHDACCGVIDGGEWYNCGKGGVASPTHGAKVDVRNVYCYDNNYAGIYADSDHRFEDRGNLIFSNCVCKNNRYDMIIGDDYNVIAINCVYDTVKSGTENNITRFGIV